MINRMKTDKELVQEAARKLAFATSELASAEDYEQACKDMVEVLQYAQSIEWWKQFEREAV